MNISCPFCGKTYKLSAEKMARLSGRLTQCSACHKRFRVGEKKTSDSAEREPDVQSAPPPARTPPPLETDRRSQPVIQIDPQSRVAKSQSSLKPNKRPASHQRFVFGLAVVVVLLAMTVVAALVVVQFGSGDTQRVAHIFLKADEKFDVSGIQLNGARTTYTDHGKYLQIELEEGENEIHIARNGFWPYREVVASTTDQPVVVIPEWRARPDALGQQQQPVANQVDPQNVVSNDPPRDQPDGLAVNNGLAAGNELVDPFVEWYQDLDQAKRAAREQGKYILIYFDGSDWCPHCETFNQTLLQAEISEMIGQHFIPVHIDRPETVQMQRFVEDLERNQSLIERYGASSVPTTIAADQSGRPFGMYGGSLEGHELIDAMEYWLEQKERLDLLLPSVDRLLAAGRFPEAKLNAIHEIVGPYIVFYDELQHWVKRARELDPVNENNLRGPIYAYYWLARFRAPQTTTVDRFRLADELVDEIAGYQANQNDPSIAAPFIVAIEFSRTYRQFDRMIKYAETGLATNPADPRIRNFMQQFTVLHYLSSGTGFLISRDGLIITNRHVVEPRDLELRDSQVYVTLDGRSDEIAARVVHRSETEDLALLQVDAADLKPNSFEPLKISRAEAKLLQRVVAFGYPDFGQATGVKSTPGSVAREASQESFNRMIQLNLTVNPGNSGGPLCAMNGSVIGVVTAKTGNTELQDSSGLAIPTSTVWDFLKSSLSENELNGLAAKDQARDLAPEKLAQRVKESVVLIVRKKNSPNTFDEKISADQALAINNEVWENVKSPVGPDQVQRLKSDLELMQNVCSQHPRGIYFNTLATAEFRMGNYRAAIAAAKQSLKRTPGEMQPPLPTPYPGDLAILAMSYLKLGEPEPANRYREDLNQAIKLEVFRDDQEVQSFVNEVERAFAADSKK